MSDDTHRPSAGPRDEARECATPRGRPAEPLPLDELLAELPPRFQLAAARLTSLLLMYASAGAPLDGMLEEIDAISQYGVDPDRQLARLETLLERWRPKH